MSRPSKPDEETKHRVLITLDKSIYENAKKQGLNLSRTINHLLRIAISTDTALAKSGYRTHNRKFNSRTDFLIVL